jgi:hypothetical protein
MTLAERLMEADPLTLSLGTQQNKDEYIAEFKPGYENPLQIKSKDYDADDPMGSGEAIFLSYESAVELAKFMKRLFIDEDT